MSGSASNPISPNNNTTQSFMNHTQHVQDKDETIFLGLQIAGGHILLPLLVLTILFSSKIKRHPAFISFCFSWIFSSVVFSLLIYRGRSTHDNLSLAPTYDECLIQASLLNGLQTWTVCTTLVIVLHFWLSLRGIIKNKPCRTGEWMSGAIYTLVTVGGPFIVFVAFTITSMIMGSQRVIDPGSHQPIPDSNLSVSLVFNCVIILNFVMPSLRSGMKLFNAVFFFQMVLSFLTLCAEVDIVRLLYTYRKKLSSGAHSINRVNYFCIFLRLVSFSLFRIFALFLFMLLVLNPKEMIITGFSSRVIFNGIINYMQAALPLVAFLVFSTEKDVLDAWRTWILSGWTRLRSILHKMNANTETKTKSKELPETEGEKGEKEGSNSISDSSSQTTLEAEEGPESKKMDFDARNRILSWTRAKTRALNEEEEEEGPQATTHLPTPMVGERKLKFPDDAESQPQMYLPDLDLELGLGFDPSLHATPTRYSIYDSDLNSELDSQTRASSSHDRDSDHAGSDDSHSPLRISSPESE